MCLRMRDNAECGRDRVDARLDAMMVLGSARLLIRGCTAGEFAQHPWIGEKRVVSGMEPRLRTTLGVERALDPPSEERCAISASTFTQRHVCGAC
jgi:hypothetical protein